jgi:hypothetical protein
VVPRHGDSQTISIGSSGTNITTDYNFVTTMGSYAAVSGFGEAHGINGGNPQLTNAGANDFHLLSSSPAIGRAVTLTGYVDDFDGHTRSVPWDIGAFEH